MRTSTIILTLFTLTTSCSINYASKNYLDTEDKAILDLIPKMVDADYMLEHNDYGASKPTLYIIADLDNELPTVESQIEEISESDKRQLEPLIKKTINKRTLSENLFNGIDKFAVKTLTLDEFKKNHEDNLTENVHKERLLGYLWVSRIIFTNDFKKGYISFSFFCGEGCAWDSVIEINKVNGKWAQSRYICGGIA